MSKFIITTESGSDLPHDIQAKYDIRIIPMHVTMGDESFEDGSRPVIDVFNYYEETDRLPKTSGTTPDDNILAFARINAEHPDAEIIHIAYSGVTTVSYSAAKLAAEDFPNVHIVDSKNVTLGLTAIIIATMEYIEAHPEATWQDVVAFVEDVRERTRFIFIPRTLVYLKAGGRVSNLAFHGARLLNLHPTIVLKNGYLLSGKKYRGSYPKCMTKAIEDFFKNYNIDPTTVWLGGSPGLEAEYQEMAYDLVGKYRVPRRPWFYTGMVISSHGGPAAFGMVGIEYPQ